jgi:ribosomal protein L37AE/L43A
VRRALLAAAALLCPRCTNVRLSRRSGVWRCPCCRYTPPSPGDVQSLEDDSQLELGGEP